MFVFVSLLVCQLRLVASKGFLSGHHRSFVKEEVEHTLATELPLTGDTAQLAAYQEDLRVMYNTLPKNEFGRVSFPTVRYALHRYFVHKHGWYVKGLDPEGGAWNVSHDASANPEWASLYIAELFEKRFHNEGLGLMDLSAFAATLSDLIFGEGVSELEDIYETFDLPLHGMVSPRMFDKVVRGYMAVVTIGDTAELTSINDLSALETEAAKIDSSYPDTVMWLRDMRLSFVWHERSRSNPFHRRGVTWERATEFMKQLLHSMGGILRMECNSKKNALVDLEDGSPGRLTLATFYQNKHLLLHESAAFLRNQGALEEGHGPPRLVIPNYVNSPSRCLPFSGYFAVCCPNECESLMGKVERAVAAPSATPRELIDVVSALSSETVAAPRNLSATLLTRLHEIAAVHHGSVPLHGRLFSQWMHHAFPRECPFPHLSGTVKAASQEEWLDMHDDIRSIRVSDEEAEAYIAAYHNMEVRLEALPWSSEEELVSAHVHVGKAARGSYLRPLMALMAIVSFGYPLVMSFLKVLSNDERVAKANQHAVLV